jgi:ATP-dependent DNA helicase RecG
MTIIDRVKKLLRQGEGIRIEYKEAKNQLPGDTFDTICAFLNHDGGDLILGVSNNGDVIGANDDSVDKLKRDLVNQSNNTNKGNTPSKLH